MGLRPARRGDICLEWDPVCSSVLHNYGHGGSGVTLSWGCASEVCALIDHALKRRRLIYVSSLWTLSRKFCWKITWWWNVFITDFLFIAVARRKLLRRQYKTSKTFYLLYILIYLFDAELLYKPEITIFKIGFYYGQLLFQLDPWR